MNADLFDGHSNLGNIDIEDVIHVPELPMGLISVGQLDDKGFDIRFNKGF